ncbi:HLA class II histocompatibility antigen, DP beta 1 chain-like, partial [Terrapene carolina triunguis]|uniref:HLA class II histocompatibility antigen, DP beta 1 chain-like n=1 Tax=Terrapene triunguis TaxID=2587831 RepID=UPI0011562FDD
QPKVKVSPTKSGSGPHSHLLVCSVMGVYPGGIEIKWLKNGQEQTAGAVFTELLQNGDWTFQILVMLEMSPQRGDVYTCQVEHISLRGPLAVHWVAQPDSARTPMLLGVGGFVLGLISLTPGLLTYLKTTGGAWLWLDLTPAPRPGSYSPGGPLGSPSLKGLLNGTGQRRILDPNNPTAPPSVQRPLNVPEGEESHPPPRAPISQGPDPVLPSAPSALEPGTDPALSAMSPGEGPIPTPGPGPPPEALDSPGLTSW